MAEAEEEEVVEHFGGLTSALPWDLEHVPLEFNRIPVSESQRRAEEFFELLNTRRTVRFFSSDQVPDDIIKNIIRAAGNNLCTVWISFVRCVDERRLNAIICCFRNRPKWGPHGAMDLRGSVRP